MNQSIFIIRSDFFDNPKAGQEFVHKLVSANCNSEKLALLYDPLAEDFFTHIAKSNRDLFEEIVRDFYIHFEESKSCQFLKWYQLDELSTYHLSFLSPILYELDDGYGAYLIGCLPLVQYDSKSSDLHLFFCMNDNDLEDTFILVNGKEYMDTLEYYITKFNDYVNSSKKGKKVSMKKKK